jgi:hypothetical protein
LFEDTSISPHLTQSAYEESLICNQLDELCQEEQVNQTEAQNKYNLRSKQNRMERRVHLLSPRRQMLLQNMHLTKKQEEKIINQQ